MVIWRQRLSAIADYTNSSHNCPDGTPGMAACATTKLETKFADY